MSLSEKGEGDLRHRDREGKTIENGGRGWIDASISQRVPENASKTPEASRKP